MSHLYSIYLTETCEKCNKNVRFKHITHSGLKENQENSVHYKFLDPCYDCKTIMWAPERAAKLKKMLEQQDIEEAVNSCYGSTEQKEETESNLQLC